CVFTLHVNNVPPPAKVSLKQHFLKQVEKFKEELHTTPDKLPTFVIVGTQLMFPPCDYNLLFPQNIAELGFVAADCLIPPPPRKSNTRAPANKKARPPSSKHSKSAVINPSDDDEDGDDDN